VKTARPTLLVVDDEALNLEVLIEHLDGEAYHTVAAKDGLEAWQMLQKEPDKYDTVVLDRMMPHMDGMAVLGRMKADDVLKMVPVILQTAKAAKSDILEGLQAGAYYYLTKPFEKDQLLAIVKTAVSDYANYKLLREELTLTTGTLALMNSGNFTLRTLNEANSLATFIAKLCPNPKQAVLGLSELLINAIEHGNLGITYDEKTILNENNEWYAEVNRRLALTEHINKMVTLEVEITKNEVCFTIMDEGEGFDWKSYLEVSPDRAFDNHGRGIPLARTICFDNLEYIGSGNKVRAVIASKKNKKITGVELTQVTS
jgi:CheY-like chemotaxis protein